MTQKELHLKLFNYYILLLNQGDENARRWAKFLKSTSKVEHQTDILISLD